MTVPPPPFILALKRLYPECIETHISWVFLRPDDVVKVKKPVRFSFLDFSTQALRRAACEAEIALNRRLAPDVYLGVVPITMSDAGEVAVAGEGRVIEHAVHMRRLPDRERVEAMLSRGALTHEHVEHIAERIAGFHAAAEVDTDPDGPGAFATLNAHARDNLEALRDVFDEALGPDAGKALIAAHLGALHALEPVLARRREAGFVRDGHGDLRLDHVYIDAGGQIRVLDCVEFDRAFRVADVCADVAFFAMSLMHASHVELAERFLARYARDAADHELYALVDFYIAYWALVRAKVTHARAQQTEGEEASALAQQVAALLKLAHEVSCRRTQRPAVLAVGGIIASGKSRLAARVADELCAPVLQSDRIRKQQRGRAPDEKLPAEAYADDATERLYQDLLARAEVVIASGRPVVVDASFRKKRHRDALSRLAHGHAAPFLFVACEAPRDVLEARLRRREQKRGVSDARIDLLDAFAASYEPIAEDERPHAVRVDTSGEKEETFQRVAPKVLSVCPPLA